MPMGRSTSTYVPALTLPVETSQIGRIVYCPPYTILLFELDQTVYSSKYLKSILPIQSHFLLKIKLHPEALTIRVNKNCVVMTFFDF